MTISKELMEKAKQAKSAEELLALAKENGIEMTEEKAREIYNSLHSSTELADEELDNVAGGCGTDGEIKNTPKPPWLNPPGFFE